MPLYQTCGWINRKKQCHSLTWLPQLHSKEVFANPLQLGGFSRCKRLKHFSTALHTVIVPTDGILSPPLLFMKISSGGFKSVVLWVQLSSQCTSGFCLPAMYVTAFSVNVLSLVTSGIHHHVVVQEIYCIWACCQSCLMLMAELYHFCCCSCSYFQSIFEQIGFIQSVYTMVENTHQY
jgi:hypothetical protein